MDDIQADDFLVLSNETLVNLGISVTVIVDAVEEAILSEADGKI